MWLLKIALLLNSAALVLSMGIYDPGEVTHSINIKVGDSANMTCLLNINNKDMYPRTNSSNMNIKNITASPQQVLSTKIVNESTIIYMLRNATAQNSKLRCDIGNSVIDETIVNVGWAPQPVQNFSCYSYELEYLVCNFTSLYNPVPVVYDLYFYIESSKYNFTVQRTNYNAGAEIVVGNITGNGLLRHFYEFYDITLSASNNLEPSLQQIFPINIYNVTIPSAPGKGLKVISITPSTILLSWHMNHYCTYKQINKGLQFNLRLFAQNNSELLRIEQMAKNEMYTPENGIVQWRVRVSSQKKECLENENLELEINNLPYAFYKYTLNLRVKLNSSRMWSEPFVHTFQSTALRPVRAPRTNAGSFYIDPTFNTVRLYWEELEPFERNGDHFTYIIEEIQKDGTKLPLELIGMESNSALLFWQKETAHNFTIRSKNDIGHSLEASYINVPAQHEKMKSTQIHLHKFHNDKNRTYTISWLPVPVEDNERLISYTAYWCESKAGQQNKCKGSIHFKELKPTQLNYTTEPQTPQQEYSLNLAVSANYEHFNTGMKWATCTVFASSNLKKMVPIVEAINASVIKVQFSLENVCPSILLGYNLTYCALAKQDIYTNNRSLLDKIPCNETAQIISITDPNAKRWDIENLKPYTLYRIQMNMFSSTENSSWSSPEYKRTSEAAPTPPDDLQFSHVRNTSVIISWLPPKQANGNITYYVVHFNKKERTILTTEAMSNAVLQGRQIEYTLDELSCNTYYEIYLKAHTVTNSLPSNSINFTTQIGYPQAPVNVKTDTADDKTMVNWSRPLFANGRLDFYEVEVVQFRNDIIQGKHISIVNGTECFMSKPPCPNMEYKTIVNVRAVNVANIIDLNITDSDVSTYWNYSSSYYKSDNDLRCDGRSHIDEIIIQKYAYDTNLRFYRSDLASGPQYNCSETSLILMIALLVVISSLGVMIGLHLAREKYNKMANIHCTLPPGLDIYITKDGVFSVSANDCNNSAAGGVSIGRVAMNCTSDVVHNEKHHLLPSIGNDINYLDEVTAVAAAGARCIDENRGIALQQAITTDYVNCSDSLVGSNASTAEAELCETDLQVNTTYISAEEIKNDFCSSGDSNSQLYAKNQEETDEHDQEENEDAKEYKPMNIKNCSEYVAFEDLNKPIRETTATTSKPSTDLCDYTTVAQLAGYMSGYVTQGELNAFGQQQKQNKRMFE